MRTFTNGDAVVVTSPVYRVADTDYVHVKGHIDLGDEGVIVHDVPDRHGDILVGFGAGDPDEYHEDYVAVEGLAPITPRFTVGERVTITGDSAFLGHGFETGATGIIASGPDEDGDYRVEPATDADGHWDYYVGDADLAPAKVEPEAFIVVAEGFHFFKRGDRVYHVHTNPETGGKLYAVDPASAAVGATYGDKGFEEPLSQWLGDSEVIPAFKEGEELIVTDAAFKRYGETELTQHSDLGGSMRPKVGDRVTVTGIDAGYGNIDTHTGYVVHASGLRRPELEPEPAILSDEPVGPPATAYAVGDRVQINNPICDPAWNVVGEVTAIVADARYYGDEPVYRVKPLLGAYEDTVGTFRETYLKPVTPRPGEFVELVDPARLPWTRMTGDVEQDASGYWATHWPEEGVAEVVEGHYSVHEDNITVRSRYGGFIDVLASAVRVVPAPVAEEEKAPTFKLGDKAVVERPEGMRFYFAWDNGAVVTIEGEPYEDTYNKAVGLIVKTSCEGMDFTQVVPLSALKPVVEEPLAEWERELMDAFGLDEARAEGELTMDDVAADTATLDVAADTATLDVEACDDASCWCQPKPAAFSSREEALQALKAATEYLLGLE